MLRLLWLASLAASAAACGDDAPTCVEVNPECAPLYEPTYAEVFERTLAPTCGVSGRACHGREGAKGGLVFADPDEAYDRLLGSDGRPRVIPGDAACSLLTRRLEAENPAAAMPPGDPLPAAERCAIERWIAEGANREDAR